MGFLLVSHSRRVNCLSETNASGGVASFPAEIEGRGTYIFLPDKYSSFRRVQTACSILKLNAVLHILLPPQQSDQAAGLGIVTLCCRVKSSKVSLGIFTWSPLVISSEPAPTPAPVPAPMAAPFPPPASAPMRVPMAAPPTVLFAVLSLLDLPETSYSPLTSGMVWPLTTIPVSWSLSCDLPVKVPVSFDSSNRP